MSDQGTRWHQAQELMLENALDVATMAACLGVDEAKLENMIGLQAKRKIPDSLAQQMEQTFSKPQGWLDQGDDGGITFDLFGS
jgi:plasmid maintenance system antidote protein VapI